MKLEAEAITFFICAAFALLGLFNHIFYDEPFLPFWIVSFFSLVATIGIDVIGRIDFEFKD